MYTALAVFAAVVGLGVTGTAVFTAWFVRRQWNMRASSEEGREPFAMSAGRVLLRWTAFDYAVVALFLIGSVFLIVDCIGMMRDRGSYPPYHYGYLLSGSAFSILGMLFMVVRMGVVLKLASGSASAAAASEPHNHDEPAHADQPEQRI